MKLDPRLHEIVEKHAYPLVFASISGAHLYGFPSPDSDWDLRGVHVLPAAELLGLDPGPETIEVLGDDDGLDLDLVTHDAAKFIRLMLKPNGYVLEQLLSPLVVRTTSEHDELCAVAPACVTSHHARHYLGFAAGQRKLLAKAPPRVKPMLYLYRVLLTGIHLMRTGEIEANLVHLNADRDLPGVADLIASKTGGAEKEPLATGDLAFHMQQTDRLEEELHAAAEATTLPDAHTARPALNDFLLRLRGAL